MRPNGKSKNFVATVATIIIAAAIAWAQRGVRPPSEGRHGVPDWQLNKEMPRDVFTFVRIRYSSNYGRRGGGWHTDYPDADLNFSFACRN